jgi:hypothetical protein
LFQQVEKASIPETLNSKLQTSTKEKTPKSPNDVNEIDRLEKDFFSKKQVGFFL